MAYIYGMKPAYNGGL